MKKIIYTTLLIMYFIACNNKIEDVNINSSTLCEDVYSRWIFYSINFHIEKGILLCPKFGISALDRKINLLEEIIISNKFEKGDTIIYLFYIWDSESKCIIRPREFWFPWVIVEKNTSQLLALMPPISRLVDVNYSVENFHDFNCSLEAQNLPTGKRSPFPVENSIIEFEDFLESQKDLKNDNPWLFYYYNFVIKNENNLCNFKFKNNF